MASQVLNISKDEDSGQPLSVFNHPGSKKMFSYILVEFHVFQSFPIASGPIQLTDRVAIDPAQTQAS